MAELCIYLNRSNVLKSRIGMDIFSSLAPVMFTIESRSTKFCMIPASNFVSIHNITPPRALLREKKTYYVSSSAPGS